MRNYYSINWLIPGLDKAKCSSQIEDFIKNQIKAKNLHGGDLIPSSRELAKVNNVSASSVRRAYTRLIVDSWLSSIQGSGTTVSLDNPAEIMPHKTTGFTEHFPAGLAFLNKKLKIRPDNFIEQPFTAVGTDFPCPAAFPEDKFSEYYHKHSEQSRNLSQGKLLTEYDSKYLKDALVDHLNRRREFGLKHNMLAILKGRKSCLDRVFKILIDPGDVVINTSPYDIKLAAALTKCKAQVFTISRQDPDFIDQIEHVLKYTKVRAIHIRPQCSVPEGLTLNSDNCNRLIQLAKEYRLCIIEEEEDHEFWYGDTAYKSLASYDHDGYVIYIGALSKATSDTLALRLIVASAQFINGLLALPAQSIETRDIIKERSLAELIIKGDMNDYARQIRMKSKNYRDQLNIILNHHLNEFVSYVVPEHGLTFWLKFDLRFDLNTILKTINDNRILIPYHPNNQKTNIKTNFLLLGFGAFDYDEADGWARMLKIAIQDYRN